MLSRIFLTLLTAIAVTGCSSKTASKTKTPAKSGTKTTAEAIDTQSPAVEPKSRRFKFVYGAAISQLTPGAKARVWIPVAQSSHDQKITLGKITTPGEYRVTKEKKFGNRVIYFEATANDAGQIPLSVEYEVERREVLANSGETFDEAQRELFLAASAKVPVDGSLKASLLGDRPLVGEGIELGRGLYNVVEDHMKYSKTDPGWGRGDAAWACDSKFGNCTDFHSLFIGVSRDLKVPAKFEIGFPLPPQRGAGNISGYHCWAKFASGARWVGVDISEADKDPTLKDYCFGNLTENRVTFTTGRDLTLDPPPAAGPVNFLVYPYVEVDGKPHKKFKKGFRYEDL